MFMPKVKLESKESLLVSLLIAAAVILALEMVPFPPLAGLRALLGLYLFFYPIGALSLKVLGLKSRDFPEHLLMVMVSSLSINVLLPLVLHLGVGLELSLLNALAVLSLSGAALFIIARVREK